MGKAVLIDQSGSGLDFAPGVRNVALRRGGVEYYAVETFHSSPFYDAVTPVLVCDLVGSVGLLDIYGYAAVAAVRENVTLLKNHPLRQVRIMGRISEYQLKEIRGEDFYFLALDDSTGASIQCMAHASLVRESTLSLTDYRDSLVEVFGVCQVMFKQLEVKVSRIRLHRNNQLTHQLQFWDEALRVRNVLKTPWYQTPQYADDACVPVRMDKVAQRRKYMEQNMDLDSHSKDEPSLVLDSSIYMAKKSIGRVQRHAMAENQDISSDSDVEEITKELFDQICRTNKMMVSSRATVEGPYRALDLLIRRFKTYTMNHLIITLMKWVYHNGERRFRLNDQYMAPMVYDYLRLLSEQHFSTQVVDRSETLKLRSSNEVHGELFHRARHSLQVSGLIVCTKSKMCSSGVLLDFTVELYQLLHDVQKRDARFIFAGQEFVRMFNRTKTLDVEVSDDILDGLIAQFLKEQKCKGWGYYEGSRHWGYKY